MSARGVVFLVLMVIWLLGGGWVAYDGPAFSVKSFGLYTIVPWVCVAILGWIVLEKRPS